MGRRQVVEINVVIEAQLRFPRRSGQPPKTARSSYGSFLVPFRERSPKSCPRAKAVRFRPTVLLSSLIANRNAPARFLIVPFSDRLTMEQIRFPVVGNGAGELGITRSWPAGNGISAMKKPAVRHQHRRGSRSRPPLASSSVLQSPLERVCVAGGARIGWEHLYSAKRPRVKMKAFAEEGFATLSHSRVARASGGLGASAAPTLRLGAKPRPQTDWSSR
jgi:hypothetical protein